MNRLSNLIILAFFTLTNLVVNGQREDGYKTEIPLPPYITRLSYFGERADWSHDGSKILFIEKTYGDVFEYDLVSKKLSPLTHHFYHGGFTRALYLANGDILLSGSMHFDASKAFSYRVFYPELWVLDKSLKFPPVPLGEKCSEGPAVSRNKMRIAWTIEYRQFPDRLKKGEDEIYLADIEYLEGKPKLTNKKKVFPVGDRYPHLGLETQNFVPPDDTILIFTSYNVGGSEVMGLNLNDGTFINFSRNEVAYDEAEGIYPDGKYTLVESDQHAINGIQNIDIWKLTLDTSGDYERLTYFYDLDGFKSSNPVVSDDGKYMAFQMAMTGDSAGVGRGIFVYGFELKKKLQPGKWITKNPTGELDPRHENGFVEADGKFYLLGGRGIKPVNIYDPESNSWNSGAPPPLELHHFQAITYQGEIYIIGAMTGAYPSEKPVANIYIYSPALDKWRKGLEIPKEIRRGAAGTVLLDNQVYLIGGIKNGHMDGFTNRMDRLDLTTGKWERLPDAPRCRDHFQAVIYNGKIYAPGGRTTSYKTGQVFDLTVSEADIFDIETQAWNTLELPLPTPRAGASVVMFQGKIVVIGGESIAKHAHKEVEVYDIGNGTWSSFDFLNQARHGTQAIVHKGKIYIASGSGSQGGSPELGSIEVFSLE